MSAPDSQGGMIDPATHERSLDALYAQGVEHGREAAAEQIARAIEARGAELLPEWLRSNYADAARIARAIRDA